MLCVGELTDFESAFVVSRRIISIYKQTNEMRSKYSWLSLIKTNLPVGFETFNVDGRFICDRSIFSVKIVDDDGLLFADEWTAPVFNSSSLYLYKFDFEIEISLKCFFHLRNWT